MSNQAIIDAWRHSEGAVTLSGCLACLNTALNTRYDLSRLGQWRNGKRPIPAKVRRYMLGVGMARLLESAAHPQFRGVDYSVAFDLPVLADSVA